MLTMNTAFRSSFNYQFAFWARTLAFAPEPGSLTEQSSYRLVRSPFLIATLCTHNICICLPRGIFLHVTSSVPAKLFYSTSKYKYPFPLWTTRARIVN